MKLVAAAAVLAPLALAGCDECLDDNPDTTCGGGGGAPDLRGERYSAAAIGPAGDRVVAIVSHTVYGEDDAITSTHSLVELDAAGEIAAATPPMIDFDGGGGGDGDVMIAGDGAGSTLVVDGDRARWLDGGLPVAEDTVDGAAAIAFGDGAYWIASETAPRELRRYGADGTPAATVTLPADETGSVGRRPSLAAEPFGDVVAQARLVMTAGGEPRVVVDRVRAGATRTFALGTFENADVLAGEWASSVAVHAGIVAVLYGMQGGDTRIAMVMPDDRIETVLVELPERCTSLAGTGIENQLYGTPTGFVGVCGYGRELALLDPTGDRDGTAQVPSYTRIAAADGVTLAVSSDDADSLMTRTIAGADVGAPVTVFAGDVEDHGGGCSAAPPSSLAGVLLALVPVLRRRRRRASRSPYGASLQRTSADARSNVAWRSIAIRYA